MDIRDLPDAQLYHLASSDEEAAAEWRRRLEASRDLTPSAPREMKAARQNPVPVRTPRQAVTGGRREGFDLSPDPDDPFGQAMYDEWSHVQGWDPDHPHTRLRWKRVNGDPEPAEGWAPEPED